MVDAQIKETDNFVERIATEVQMRQAKIERELKVLDRAKLKEDDWAKDWAGTYYTGDGRGRNVTIYVAPGAGIAYTWRGCLGLYDANHGEIVEAMPTSLTIKWAIDPANSKFGFLSSRLYFVRWGDRLFLVPESQMLQLVAYYNRGGFSRETLYGIPLFYEGDIQHDMFRKNAGLRGRPQLPPEHAKFIIDKPCRVAVSRLENVIQTPLAEKEIRKAEGEVELAGGRNVGLQPGLLIDWDYSKRQTVHIRLSKVDEQTARGTFSTLLLDNADGVPPVGSEIVFPGVVPNGQETNE